MGGSQATAIGTNSIVVSTHVQISFSVFPLENTRLCSGNIDLYLDIPENKWHWAFLFLKPPNECTRYPKYYQMWTNMVLITVLFVDRCTKIEGYDYIKEPRIRLDQDYLGTIWDG